MERPRSSAYSVFETHADTSQPFEVPLKKSLLSFIHFVPGHFRNLYLLNIEYISRQFCFFAIYLHFP